MVVTQLVVLGDNMISYNMLAQGDMDKAKQVTSCTLLIKGWSINYEIK